MIKSNYHIHSTYCDGKNTMEEMVLGAIKEGLEIIGFSSHNPIPGESWTMKSEQAEQYFQEIQTLKGRYKDQISILASMEVDYLPDVGFNPLGTMHLAKLDYWIGSVHSVAKWEDGSYWFVDEGEEGFRAGLEYFFQGDGKKAVTRYYELLMEMVEAGKPDLIGHMDLIKKNNVAHRYFREDETWYSDLVDRFLDVVQKKDVVLEINTGGVQRYGLSCFYPSPWILDRIRDRDLPWTLNGDSHDKDSLAYYYRETEKLLMEKGMTRYWVLEEGKWTQKKF